jgi:hypothetical protein
MASGALDKKSQFIDVGQDFLGIFLASGHSSWLPGVLCAEVDDTRDGLEMLLHGISFSWLLSLPMGGRCGWAILPLHRPTAYGCQTRAHSSLFETIRLYLVTKLLLREPLPKQARML